MPQITQGHEEDLGDGTMRVTLVSVFTGRERSMVLPVTAVQLAAWRNGELIQCACPQLSASQREFLLTGTTDDEWDEFVRWLR